MRGTLVIGRHRSDFLAFILIGFFMTCAAVASALFASLFPQQTTPLTIAAILALFALPILALTLSNWALSVYLVAAAIPFEDMMTLGSVASGFKALALLMFCALGLRLVHDPQLFAGLKRILHNPLTLSVFGLAAWSAASILWAEEQGAALTKTITFFSIFSLMLAVALLNTRQLTVLWATIAFSTVLSVPISYLLLYSPNPNDLSSQRLSTGGDPNDYASTLAIVMLVGLFGPLRRSKAAAGALGFAVLVGILTSQSRTGLVVLAAAPLAVLLLPHIWARLSGRVLLLRMLLLYFLAAVVFVGMVLISPWGDLVAERYSTLSQADSADTWTGRWSIWQGAVQIISQNPILGIGSGNFPYVSPTYSAHAAQMGGAPVAHNMFLSVASELGIVGLVLFLAILIFAFKEILPFANKGSGLAIGIFLGLIGFTLAGLSLTWEYQKIAYILCGSVLSLQLHQATQTTSKQK